MAEWYESKYPDDYIPDGPEDDQRQMEMFFGMIDKAQAKAKIDRKMDKLTKALGNLNLDDDPHDQAGTSNIIDGEIILQDADGNEFTTFLT